MADNFYLHHKVSKKEILTDFGVISIHNITFDARQLQNYLPNIIFDKDNLSFMFASDAFSKSNYYRIVKRFAPITDIRENLDNIVSDYMSHNKSFYSFLAEGMLTLVLRDLYNYKLAKGVIDADDTLNNTHQGVDSCMFDLKNGIFVLGEAKFYSDYGKGINKIIEDFLENNISNKLDHFFRILTNSNESSRLILKNLNKNEFETISMKDFLSQNLMFAGFVLHSHKGNINAYLAEDFYDNLNVTSQKLSENIDKSLKMSECTGKYQVVLFHLPIENKKALIKEIINKAYFEIDKLRGETDE